MQVFYAPGIDGKKYFLDEKESIHCIRVLRMKKNTPVKLIDGKGNLYEGIISDPNPKACQITIENVVPGYEKRPYLLHIAISPLKNPERFEWFIEKSVEIGIDEITPVICKNSEKKSVKSFRINNIIVSAMKQSLKAGVTRLNEAESFSDFLRSPINGQKLIAHCSGSFERNSISSIYARGPDAVILIGPEGDFTDKEISMAIDSGFRSVHLGNSRLRTETAGIAACHSIYLLNQ
jgi:16S rRNA (uracil1498-N3)-methyltransferase